MPTAVSSTEATGTPAPASTWWQESRRAVADVGPLIHFRTARVRGSSRLTLVLVSAVILGVTIAVATVPAFLPEGNERRDDVLLLLPSACLGVLVIAMISAAASGGGRELLARDQGVAYPVSTTTDHLGALLMAPLNIAWIVQAWTLIGATAYIVGPRATLPLALAPILAWLFAATAMAQIVAWMIEWIRRGKYGLLTFRLITLCFSLTLAILIVTDTLVDLLDQSPTVHVVVGMAAGRDARFGVWLTVVTAVLLIGLASVALGAVVAQAVVRRPARDELKEETAPRAPRSNPASDLVALMRTDRVAIWRSVPLRRGLTVLALMPGLVALAGGLDWLMLCILPGLVASGGALLFGVNSWCLDGRGALWRDSLPLSPRIAFLSRALVLGEVLLLVTALTLLMGVVRAGPITSSNVAAVLGCVVVVCTQVVAASLRWSVKSPFAVDLRSARATPAPPVVMVGYSARLAFSTTMTGMVFGVATYAPWYFSVLLTLPFLLFSSRKLAMTVNAWSDPETRCRVVATVAS